MIKVAIIGAGSIGFTRCMFRDILSVPELQDTEFRFMDIDAKNLEITTALCRMDLEQSGMPAKIIATTNRRRALEGADYIFSFVRVGGLDAFKLDIEIPLKYGVDQCVGDTLSPGGIMYAQRTIPVLLSICADIRQVAKKDALFINYSNPMAMNTWALNRYGKVRAVGLCHGVEGGHWLIANALGVKQEDLHFVAAGINHQTWYIKLIYRGKDMTGKVLPAFEKQPDLLKSEPVRVDVLKRFGYFSTESNGHLSEYLPWYRKRPGEMFRKWIDRSAWAGGETGGYLRVCDESRRWVEHDFRRWIKEMKTDTIDRSNRSKEHGSYIVEALETGRIYRGHFNVPNKGIITNLPENCIVEVPCYVDATGINTPAVGNLPLACAATCSASVRVQEMAMESAVHGDRILLKQAILHDPLTAAVCNTEEVWQMADEMLVAMEEWLPQYKKAIPAAKKYLGSVRRLGTKKYRGAFRVPARTLAQMIKDDAAFQRKMALKTDKTK